MPTFVRMDSVWGRCADFCQNGFSMGEVCSLLSEWILYEGGVLTIVRMDSVWGRCTDFCENGFCRGEVTDFCQNGFCLGEVCPYSIIWRLPPVNS